MKAVIIDVPVDQELNRVASDLPLPILRIVNKPLLFIQLEWLNRHKINEVVISCTSEKIKKLLDDTKLFDMHLYFSQQPENLGTAGALRKAAHYFAGEDLIVLYGDVLTDFNLEKAIHFHNQNMSELTICNTMRFWDRSSSVVENTDTKKVTALKKTPDMTSEIIDSGIYIIDSELIDKIPEGVQYSIEDDFLRRMITEKSVYTVNSTEYWMKINSLEKYLNIHRDILKERIATRIFATRKGELFIGEKVDFITPIDVNAPVLIGSSCRIEKNSTLDEYTVIGDNCLVDSWSYISNCVIHDNVKIGKNVCLERCIIGSDTVIEDNVKITGNPVAVVSEGSKIFRGSLF